MSTHRCDHGNVVSDQCGEYRCYECEPLGTADLRKLRDDLREEFKAEIEKLKRKIRTSERARRTRW